MTRKGTNVMKEGICRRAVIWAAIIDFDYFKVTLISGDTPDDD